jgi:anti-sigma factor RsiW
MGCPKDPNHPSHRISCKELCKFLCDYVDGDLPTDQQHNFRAHVEHCGPCREYLRQYETTIRLSKACMCPGPKPPPVPDEMIQAIMKTLGCGGSGPPARGTQQSN